MNKRLGLLSLVLNHVMNMHCVGLSFSALWRLHLSWAGLFKRQSYSLT